MLYPVLLDATDRCFQDMLLPTVKLIDFGSACRCDGTVYSYIQVSRTPRKANPHTLLVLRGTHADFGGRPAGLKARAWQNWCQARKASSMAAPNRTGREGNGGMRPGLSR